MTVRDLLAALQLLPWYAELLPSRPAVWACCEREIDEAAVARVLLDCEVTPGWRSGLADKAGEANDGEGGEGPGSELEGPADDGSDLAGTAVRIESTTLAKPRVADEERESPLDAKASPLGDGARGADPSRGSLIGVGGQPPVITMHPPCE